MKNTVPSFPRRVYNVLQLCEQQGREDIISWENSGTAFKVNDLHEFERDLLPRYFNTKKYYSFTRTLHAYGFKCVRTGRQPGIYYHASFNRNDPLSPSLIRRVRRKERRKVGGPNHAVSNPFIEAMNNRPSNPRPGKLNFQQICQFPSLIDETSSEDNGGTATIFGRIYHTIASQVADRVASIPVHRIAPASELAGILDAGVSDDESTSTGTRPIPYPTMLTSHVTAVDLQCERTSTAPIDGSLLVLGSSDMASVVAPSRNITNRSEQDHKSSLIPCHDNERNCQLQEQDYLDRIPL